MTAQASTSQHAYAGGILQALASTDHKSLGRRLIVTAFTFFFAGGILALLMRTELAQPGLQVVDTNTYNELFSMHGSTMIYLFVTPIALSLGVYLVPLQIGAPGLSGPRVALFAYWLILGGGLVMYGGFLTSSGAGRAGWTAFDPLSNSGNTPGSGMDLWIAGVTLATAGSFLLAACVLATILRRRAPGMSMLRLPVFSWTMVVTSLMTVASFPVLVVAMILLFIQRHAGGVFDGPGGPIAYQNLFWFYGHPVVYVMFFPFVGCVAEVVSAFSGKRFFGYRPMVLSLLAFTALSMSVWAHHMFTTGQVTNKYFALTSTALVVPAGIEYFDLIATMWGRRIRLAVPMLFALGFVVQFLIGGLTGVFTGSPPLDYHVHQSYFIVAHFHYTLFAGSTFGLFAGLYYWFPKVKGVVLGERLGRAHFWAMVVGTNLTFFPMFFLGWDGMVRRVADYPAIADFSTLNLLATIGAFAIAGSVLIFVLNVSLSLRRPRTAPDNPWGAATLEWFTSSPPPLYNFSELPPIRSHAPLFDLARREETVGGATTSASEQA
jgi:cytochrome c oxidase subunit 1